jgi:Ice-binding-like
MTYHVTRLFDSQLAGRRRPQHQIAAARLLFAALLGTVTFASTAQAASVALGTADSFAVLAGSTITNTGPSVISGDVGLSPGTALTGFPTGDRDGRKSARC